MSEEPKPLFEYPQHLPMPIKWPTPLALNYKCHRCHHVARPPQYMSQPCGHRFCGICAQEIDKCPGQEEDCAGTTDIVQDRALQKNFRDMLIWCPTCNAKMKFKDLEVHLISCKNCESKTDSCAQD